MMHYQSIIAVKPGKRGGKPCIRGMRISVGNILTWLSNGMKTEDILTEFPELQEEDIYAALAFAALI